ncbi:cytochrome b/b6 domain-containing protein [Marinomonas spartinae]|uniref:cytochrome b/b6 domain-containing protein n=1 Tax=Marinomonas spartinae TaxID=1792290 RepID=UPI0018F1EFD2|nr:cytochrome b/b6 domain-containing protein [Marinomonas spartinae]MBJ7556683.1 cytochrome b/b6 domain-containing protein [Marinomonas spartinae]
MKSELVWDWPIRVSHWLMALLFTGLIITGNEGGDWLKYHFYMGYSLSALIVARVLYGIWGSHYARFGQFVRSPKVVFSYLKGLLTGHHEHYAGHNPIGALMVVVLFLGLSLQWLTGLFTSDQIFWFGPFNGYASDDWLDRISTIHHTLPNILLALVALHILAVLFHEIHLKERLFLAMLHGKKKGLTGPVQVQTPRLGIVLSLVIGLAWLAVLWMMPI